LAAGLCVACFLLPSLFCVMAGLGPATHVFAWNLIAAAGQLRVRDGE
jgi:hypothetical protein